MTEGLDHETGREDYTKDGSVDLKGNPVRRSKSGGWTACSFIVVYEVFERMAYFGIAVNLVFYLTNKIHMGTVTSSNNVTNWVGTVWMTPILGAYVADTHLGRYWTFIIGSIIYLLIINAVKKKCPHIPLVLYINGNGGLLERMKDTGADVIGLDWTVDMADGRRRLGSQISVQGNVDPAYLFSPLPVLTDEIHRVVRRAGPRGHILNLGHGVLVRTPEDAAAHFFNVVRGLRYDTLFENSVAKEFEPVT